jgi:hypothetical protein
LNKRKEETKLLNGSGKLKKKYIREKRGLFFDDYDDSYEVAEKK